MCGEGEGDVEVRSAIVPVLCRHLAVACVDVVSLWSMETGQVVRSIVPEGVSALCHLTVCCACATECISCPQHVLGSSVLATPQMDPTSWSAVRRDCSKCTTRPTSSPSLNCKSSR